MFSLDGFDEGDNLLEEPDGVAIATGGGVAFPQSDDEEISTDGKYTVATFVTESTFIPLFCFIADSSFRDVSDLSAGGVAMSVPLTIPMYPPTREGSQQVSDPSGHVVHEHWVSDTKFTQFLVIYRC